jgi:hypothetical protein
MSTYLTESSIELKLSNEAITMQFKNVDTSNDYETIQQDQHVDNHTIQWKIDQPNRRMLQAADNHSMPLKDHTQ